MSLSNGIKGFVLGTAGLAAAQLFLSSSRGTAVFGTVVQAPSRWLDAWLDPSKPLIPDLRQASGGSGGGSGGGSSDPCAHLSGVEWLACKQGHNIDYPSPSSLPPSTSSVGRDGAPLSV